MKLIREVFFALLVTLFGAFFAIFAIVCLVATFDAIFADGNGWAILYTLPYAIVTFIPAFVCYKLFRKFRADN